MRKFITIEIPDAPEGDFAFDRAYARVVQYATDILTEAGAPPRIIHRGYDFAQPRFIQISIRPDHPEQYSGVYALDEHGQVWRLMNEDIIGGSTTQWEPLTTARQSKETTTT